MRNGVKLNFLHAAVAKCKISNLNNSRICRNPRKTALFFKGRIETTQAGVCSFALFHEKNSVPLCKSEDAAHCYNEWVSNCFERWRTATYKEDWLNAG